ncbi:hypothetical protein D3C81_1030590 [compost metagenome]
MIGFIPYHKLIVFGTQHGRHDILQIIDAYIDDKIPCSLRIRYLIRQLDNIADDLLPIGVGANRPFFQRGLTDFEIKAGLRRTSCIHIEVVGINHIIVVRKINRRIGNACILNLKKLQIIAEGSDPAQIALPISVQQHAQITVALYKIDRQCLVLQVILIFFQ